MMIYDLMIYDLMSKGYACITSKAIPPKSCLHFPAFHFSSFAEEQALVPLVSFGNGSLAAISLCFPLRSRPCHQPNHSLESGSFVHHTCRSPMFSYRKS
jgi:hypothetical protein